MVQIWKETGEGKAHVVFENMSVLAEMQVPRLIPSHVFSFSPWQRLSTPVSQATDPNNESSVLTLLEEECRSLTRKPCKQRHGSHRQGRCS